MPPLHTHFGSDNIATSCGEIYSFIDNNKTKVALSESILSPIKNNIVSAASYDDWSQFLTQDHTLYVYNHTVKSHKHTDIVLERTLKLPLLALPSGSYNYDFISVANSNFDERSVFANIVSDNALNGRGIMFRHVTHDRVFFANDAALLAIRAPLLAIANEPVSLSAGKFLTDTGNYYQYTWDIEGKNSSQSFEGATIEWLPTAPGDYSIKLSATGEDIAPYYHMFYKTIVIN